MRCGERSRFVAMLVRRAGDGAAGRGSGGGALQDETNATLGLKLCVRDGRLIVMCVLVKTPDETVYSAVFLEHLTADDLKRKIAERYGIDVLAITSLCRLSKRGTTRCQQEREKVPAELTWRAHKVPVSCGPPPGLTVKIDDTMVAALEDEQDFVMESVYNATDGTVAITLR